MSQRETLVACSDCGAAQIAYIGEEGTTSIGRASGCRRCGSAEFDELSVPTDGGR